MRYCPFCHRLNAGRPVICYYCGHTWHVRLCPRGHENPSNALHCGTCGSMDLSETAGPRPWFLYPVKILIFLIICCTVCFLGKLGTLLVRHDSANMVMLGVIAIALLLTAYFIAISVLPQPVKRMFRRIHQLILHGVTRIALWVGETLRELINVLLNW